jgi:uncharacterized membrane protein
VARVPVPVYWIGPSATWAVAVRTLEAKSPEGEVDTDLVSLGAYFAIHRTPTHYYCRFRPLSLELPRKESLFPCPLHMVHGNGGKPAAASVSHLNGRSWLVAVRLAGGRMPGFLGRARTPIRAKPDAGISCRRPLHRLSRCTGHGLASRLFGRHRASTRTSVLRRSQRSDFRQLRYFGVVAETRCKCPFMGWPALGRFDGARHCRLHAAGCLFDKSAFVVSVLVAYAGNLFRAVALSPGAWQKRELLLSEFLQCWRESVGVAILTATSYVLVLFAMRMASVSHVAPAREISMVIGAYFGSRLLNEGLLMHRVAGSVLIVLGVISLTLG